MDKSVIKISSIKIKNFKNIKTSEISFSDKNEIINTVGIYGQNGSGKTAVVETLILFKKLLSNCNLSDDLYYYMNADSDDFTIEYNLLYKRLDVNYNIKYTVKFAKCDIPNKVVLVNEKVEILNDKTLVVKIAAKKFRNKWHLDTENMKYEISNDVFWAACRIAEELNKSILFQDFVIDSIAGDIYLRTVLRSLQYYSIYNLFVVGMKQTSLISAVDSIVMNIRTNDKLNESNNSKLILNLFNSTTIEKNNLNIIELNINQINKIMSKLIPNFKLSYKVLKEELNPNGILSSTIQLMSVLGEKEIPLKYESEGIKKLVSIINLLELIYINESCCLVIDGLDSNVFEYLLGQVVKTIKEGAKGQLIFTSHNFRLLEILPKNCIVFSTNNPENRFVKIKNVKPNNNLRDFYYRTIILGGQKEELYNETDEFELAMAFKNYNFK